MCIFQPRSRYFQAGFIKLIEEAFMERFTPLAAVFSRSHGL